MLPGLDGLNGPYARGETGIALYDLDRDPGERYNVAENHPDIVARLLEKGEYYRSRLGDGDRIVTEVIPGLFSGARITGAVSHQEAGSSKR
ncbi:MAG: hypothetical protein MUP70_15850 [Candidatus Aminicenantes bacterium]|nr:hypothetical protein [Candidatus Aminicenantes bacterium]